MNLVATLRYSDDLPERSVEQGTHAHQVHLEGVAEAVASDAFVALGEGHHTTKALLQGPFPSPADETISS